MQKATYGSLLTNKGSIGLIQMRVFFSHFIANLATLLKNKSKILRNRMPLFVILSHIFGLPRFS